MHPDDLPRARLVYEEYIAGRTDFYECEYRLQTPAGWRWMHDRGRVVARNAAGAPLRLGGTSQDANARKALESALADSASREQKRLSYDLHDGLGQELVGIQYLLSGVARRLESGQRIRGPDIEHIAELVRSAITSTRSIAHGLAPPSLAQGDLGEALRTLASSMSTAPGLTVDFSGSAATAGLISATTAEHLYRITQEALNNARTHGHATNISMAVRTEAECLELSILDNGGGMPELRPADTGLGLRIMAHRAQMTGSQLHVLPGPQGGVHIVVRCPLRSPQ